eukprot:762613-Hanusia_phi.AAC.1
MLSVRLRRIVRMSCLRSSHVDFLHSPCAARAARIASCTRVPALNPACPCVARMRRARIELAPAMKLVHALSIVLKRDLHLGHMRLQEKLEEEIDNGTGSLVI